MFSQSIEFSKSKLDRLFPFHVVLDNKLTIQSLGKSFLKMNIDCVGKPFFDAFIVARPFIEEFTFDKLMSLQNDLIIIKTNGENPINFRGEIEFFEKEKALIFFGSPWFNSIDELTAKNLTIHDFAKHDPLIDLLHVLKSQEITNDEVKELLIRVTKQKRVAEATNRQLSLLQTLLNNSTDAMQMAYIDGRLFYINKEASKRLGISVEEIHNYNVKDFEKVFEEDAAWEEHVQELRDKKQLTVEGINEHQQTGKVFPVEVTVSYIEVGGREYIVASSRDVTNRKAFEEKLRIQEEKYRNIIENMNLGIVEVDNEEIIQYANLSFAELVGVELENLMGIYIGDIMDLGKDKDKIETKRKLRQQGISDNYEIQVRLMSGEEKWWFISGAPNFNDKGELIGSIGIHLDVTEKKVLENELELAKERAEEASKAKEAFLANMSHEIRTPLNAIIGIIRELGRDELSQQQEFYLNHMDTAARHLLSIVNSILDISKIEAGELELDEIDFSFSSVIGNVNSIMQSKAKRKGIDLDFWISPDLFQAHLGDAARIRQILLNLVSNAIKFTEEGGVLLEAKVETTQKNVQHIKLVIADTGIGMNKKYLKDVFSKFSQEEKTTARRYGGTGLGMSITYEIVRLMDGKIHVESEKGKGTKIIVDFELRKGDPRKLIKQSEEIIQNSLEGVRVLLVEDNEMNRFIAIQSLDYFGCVVDEAEDGFAAIEKINNNEYDLILMDIQMPNMDGVETTKIIRNELKIDTPIIAVTANAFKKDINLYLSIGMNDYVTKPFEEKLLYDAINVQINASYIQKEHAALLAGINEQNLYSLEKLEKISRGNQDFVREMVNIFMKNTPNTLDEIHLAFKEEDYMKVSKLAHRLKPSIGNMGIEGLKGAALEIEQYAKGDTIDAAFLKSKIENLDHYLQKVLNKLHEDFHN